MPINANNTKKQPKTKNSERIKPFFARRALGRALGNAVAVTVVGTVVDAVVKTGEGAAVGKADGSADMVDGLSLDKGLVFGLVID